MTDCRRCSECPDAPHHALLPEPDPHGEGEGERWYIPCKHCPAEGWYCAKCNEDDEGDIDPDCDSCGGFGVEWAAEVTVKTLDDGDEKRLPTVEVTVPREMVEGEPTAEALRTAESVGCCKTPHCQHRIARAIDEVRREEHSNRGEVMAACILAHRNGWTVSAVARLKDAVEQLIAKDEP